MSDDSIYRTGKTKPAQLEPAPMTERKVIDYASMVEPIPTKGSEPISPPPIIARSLKPPDGIVAESKNDDSIEKTADGSAPPILGSRQPMAPPIGMILPDMDLQADEERTMIAVLRLVGRVSGTGTLSPIERAFVAGAKVMFDQLSKECREMLKRQPFDLTRSAAPFGQVPTSTGNTEATPQPPPKSKKPKGSK